MLRSEEKEKDSGWERMTSRVQRSTFPLPVTWLWLWLTPAVRALDQPTSLLSPGLMYLFRSAILVAQTIAGSVRFHAVSDGIYI
jgi:hypothetical protein